MLENPREVYSFRSYFYPLLHTPGIPSFVDKPEEIGVNKRNIGVNKRNIGVNKRMVILNYYWFVCLILFLSSEY